MKITSVCRLHYFRLVTRSLLFVALLFIYIRCRLQYGTDVLLTLEKRPVILTVFWLFFVFEMVLRFFPSGIESPGSQKQFAKNYVPTGEKDPRIEDNHATVLVMLIWVGGNSIFGILHMYGIMDDGMMLLLCSIYSICDIVCILFFCPFQTYLMKNRCCVTCRIYNWDYPMMFTPLFFVRRFYAWSLFIMSLILLARWEITEFRHPERFAENTNAYLRCAGCSEKLCRYKKIVKNLGETLSEKL